VNSRKGNSFELLDGSGDDSITVHLDLDADWLPCQHSHRLFLVAYISDGITNRITSELRPSHRRAPIKCCRSKPPQAVLEAFCCQSALFSGTLKRY
jgi:hypothetical protein